MILHAAHKRTEPENMQIDDLSFATVKRAAQLHEPGCLFADSIIIESDKEGVIRKVLKMLRSSHEPEMYLKPVFLKSLRVPQYLVTQTDGIVTNETMTETAKRADEIFERIENIKTGTINLDFQSAILLKSMQFAYTRNRTFKPYADRFSKIGYSFPFLSAFCETDEHLRLLKILGDSVKEDYWEAKILDKVNLCQSCEGTYLNFRETCSNCDSLDLEPENIIHHFRCAYVGPESDFRRGEDLVCPKCDKTLRHIGIDYDKPSEINNCKSCGHQSQESEMKAKCVDCRHEMDLEYIETKKVSELKLTQKGMETAIKGFPTYNMSRTDNSVQQDDGVLSWQIFEMMVKQERQRANFQKTESHIGILTLDGRLSQTLDQRTKQLLQFEINQIIKGYLRPIDLLTNKGFEQYLFLMPDLEGKDAELIKGVIQNNLNTMLADNLNFGRNLVKAELKNLTDTNDLSFYPPAHFSSDNPRKHSDIRSKGRDAAWSKSQLT